MLTSKILTANIQNIIFYKIKNEENFYKEGVKNWKEHSLSQIKINKISAKRISKFLSEIENQYNLSAGQPAYFYSWIDKQTPSINCSFVSIEYTKLPFDSNYVIVTDKAVVSRIFLYELQKAEAEINLRKFSETGIFMEVVKESPCECKNTSYTYVYRNIVGGKIGSN